MKKQHPPAPKTYVVFRMTENPTMPTHYVVPDYSYVPYDSHRLEDAERFTLAAAEEKARAKNRPLNADWAPDQAYTRYGVMSLTPVKGGKGYV